MTSTPIIQTIWSASNSAATPPAQSQQLNPSSDDNLRELLGICQRDYPRDTLSKKLEDWALELINGTVECNGEENRVVFIAKMIEFLRKNILQNPLSPECSVKNPYFDGTWLWEKVLLDEWTNLASISGVTTSPYDPNKKLDAKIHLLARDIIAWANKLIPPPTQLETKEKSDQSQLNDALKMQKIMQWVSRCKDAEMRKLLKEKDEKVEELTSFVKQKIAELNAENEAEKVKAPEHRAKQDASVKAQIKKVETELNAKLDASNKEVNKLTQRVGVAEAVAASNTQRITQLEDTVNPTAKALRNPNFSQVKAQQVAMLKRIKF